MSKMIKKKVIFENEIVKKKLFRIRATESHKPLILKQGFEMNRSEIEIALKECEFFKKFKEQDVRKIAPLCRINHYEQGDFVFQQGDYGDHLYIIAEGQVFLERSVDLGGRKGNVVIEALGRGRVFGCWSTLLDDPHYLMSSATCQKPSKIIGLRGTDLRKEMISNKEIGFQILEKLSFLLRDRIQAAYGALEKF